MQSPHMLSSSQAPWLNWPETQQLVAAFATAGESLRFVGGAVRDSVLRREVSDIDAATPAPPQKVMSLLEHAQIKAIPTGLSHGTITAVIGGKPFEITTLRRDVRSHGRHADVLFTTDWREDALRRDFTMNALYCDPNGEIHDELNAIEDVQAGMVRFIGDATQRITEDALRMLRFFRFSAHYALGELDAQGLNACHQQRRLLAELSGERVGQEMKKLLQAERAAEMIEQMVQSKISGFVLPGRIDPGTLALYPTINLMADAQAEPMIALALMLRMQPTAQAKESVDWVVGRWKLSNKEATFLSALVAGESLAMELEQAEQKQKLRAVGKSLFAAHVLISWCERLQETPDNTQMLAAGYRAMLRLVHQWVIPVFPLQGTDLIACGIPAGPELGTWLATLEQWWEREEYTPDKAAILAYFEAQR